MLKIPELTQASSFERFGKSGSPYSTGIVDEEIASPI
jgi:hypothetical protein